MNNLRMKGGTNVAPLALAATALFSILGKMGVDNSFRITNLVSSISSDIVQKIDSITRKSSELKRTKVDMFEGNNFHIRVVTEDADENCNHEVNVCVWVPNQYGPILTMRLNLNDNGYRLLKVKRVFLGEEKILPPSYPTDQSCQIEYINGLPPEIIELINSNLHLLVVE
mgnify:CR=1 FL=1